ncbi:MAG TPA: aquaporin [Candidatus Saccharimonadales bacterium]|nr:aquaporin [Candidatus Saccharimonadales bacterium]
MINQKQVDLVLAEFFGTATLALVVYTILARTGFPFFTGVVAGATVGIMVYVLAKFSDAHLNPAVTVGLWSLRKVSTVQAVVHIGAQLLGGLAAWGILEYFLGRSLTSLAVGDFSWKIFAAEATGGFVLLFGVASAVYQKLNQQQTALVCGGSLFLGILVASLASNGIVNPAVALGIQSWSWAYAAAPLAGAVLGANVYGLMNTPLHLGNAKKSAGRKKK